MPNANRRLRASGGARDRRDGEPVGDRDLEILRLIDEGTASETGVAYLRALVRRLAQALDARYAFVSRFSADYETVEALAFLSGDDLIDDVRYPLKGSPCERVLDGEIVAYDRDVCALFPADREELEQMGAVAYLAIPLRKPDGRVLGHLATIASEERNWSERDFGILRIFAARATAELERQDAEQSLVNANAELARRAHLESLITSISTRFVTLEADDIDRAIETSLGEVATFARSERARVFRHSEDGNVVRVTHEWVAPGVESGLPMVSHVLREEAPAVFAHFMRNEVLLVPRREALGGEFAVLRDLMRRQGVLSTIIVPMVNGNRPVGAIAFHSLHHEQSWAPQDVRLLRLLGEIIAGATVRKEQELALRHRLELERHIAALSTRFVSAKPACLDEEVDHTLRVIGELIGSDRGVLFRLDQTGEVARLANEWTAPGIPSVRDLVPELSRRDFPEVIEHFMRRHTLNSAQPEQMPQGFGKLNEKLKGVPVRSRIAVPIVDASRVLGFLGFHSLETERHWPAEDVRLLGLLGEIVGSAFARREAETVLEQARDAALGASRAKSEFLASMSHELRTPLNGILGYAQLLRRDPTLASTHGDRVAAIERCGEHLLTLIGEVLDLAKIEAGRLELEPAPFALDDLLRDLADIARVRAAQAGLTFRFETSGGLPEVLIGDERRLRQVLLNLLGNAVKFTHTGNVRFGVHGAARWQRSVRAALRDRGHRCRNPGRGNAEDIRPLSPGPSGRSACRGHGVGARNLPPADFADGRATRGAQSARRGQPLRGGDRAAAHGPAGAAASRRGAASDRLCGTSPSRAGRR